MNSMNLETDFSQFSTCDISDGLLNKYGLAEGGFLPNLTRWSGSESITNFGRAFTVLFAPKEDPRPEVNYIDEIPSGSCLTIALTLPLQLECAPFVRIPQALYGGLMTTRANYLRAAFTVVFGRIRDLEEHRALNYPTFSYGLGTCAAKMAVKPVEVNVPLSIITGEGQIQMIHPGDYMIGDAHGIVRIPMQDVLVQDLVEYVRKSKEVDELVAQDIRDGKPAKASQKARRAVLASFV
ncbi:LAMI_0E06040g1_1 [Lachancea mirantina]|uniref:LAMI_0E06040g1_1 n=1 Tax=Lachancea mirantina TaxID=1230905 RepID=A0A1G4JLK3_9SACH|nr:LAMI_0E06040g1_1 [Lachancea mirantina]